MVSYTGKDQQIKIFSELLDQKPKDLPSLKGVFLARMEKRNI